MKHQRITRRNLLKMAAVAGAGTALAACQPAVVEKTVMVEKEVTRIVVEEAGPEPVEFVWYVAWGGVYGAMNQEVADLYMEKHPEVSMETLIGKDHESLATAIAGGQPPDIAHQFWAWGRLFITQGALMDLSDFVALADGSTRENFAEAWWSMCDSRGAPFLIPYLQAGVRHATFWNTTLFEEAGLDPEQPPETLDDLMIMGEKLTTYNDAGEIEILGYNPMDYGPLNYWAPGLGADYYDPVHRRFEHNQPALLDWLTKMSDFVDKIGFDTVAAWSEGVRSMTGADPFISGKQGIVVSHGDWYPGTIQNQNPDLEGQYAVTYQPSPADITAILSYTHTLSIPKGTPNPQKAWEFVDWACGSDEVCQKSYDDSASVAPWKPWRDKQDWNAPGMKPFTEWFLNTITDADYAGPEYDPELLGLLSSEPQRRYQSAVEAVFTGELEPEEALVRLDDELQPMLDEAIRLYGV